MNDLFADTYYFIALVGPDSVDRQKAVAATANCTCRLITTAWILTELANFLHRLRDRAAFLQIFHALTTDPKVVILECNQHYFDRGITLYKSRPDKEWSLTDCISFIAMKEMRINDALTGDHHFEQAGFHALLK